MVLNYILIHLNTKEVLNSYVYFISIFALFLNFTNWGGRFFNTKEISKNPKNSKILIADLIFSKVILVFIAGFAVVFVPIGLKLRLLLLVLLFLKSLVPIFDSLIIFRKKSQIVFVTEVMFTVLFLFLVFTLGNKMDTVTFLTGFVLFELIKFGYYLITFWSEIAIRFSISDSIRVLRKSRFFFGVSMAGFVASKADLYVIGIMIDKETMSHYFIISSLSGVCMVVYATLINTFEATIYRFNHKVFQKLETSLQSFGVIFSVLSAIGFYIVMNLLYTIPTDFKFTLLFFANIFFFSLINFEMYRFTKLDKQKIVLIILLISGLINCGLSFMIVQQYLVFGAFLANTFGLLFNYLLLKIYFLKLNSNEV